MSDFGDKPFGLNQIKLVGGAGGTTVVTLPVARTLKFKERLVFGEMKGDDSIAAVASIPEAVEWEMEAGGLPLAAYALMTGRTVTTGGTSPSGTVSFKGHASIAFPYFKIYGKVLGGSGDDTHCKIFKAKLSEGVEGSFQNGEFFSTAIKGMAVDNGTDGIFEFVQNETAASLPSS